MKTRILATMLALPLAVSTAYAQDSADGPAVKISGFGTGALTWANTNDAKFGRPNQSNGADKHANAGVDSNLGLQADMQLNDRISFTAQGLVRKEGDDNFGADLTWAFAKIRLNDEWSLRIGRVGSPIFMISDYRNVGYANTMLRPPSEMYGQVPFNSGDGADLTWQHNFGATTVTTQVSIGKTKAHTGVTAYVTGDRMRALSVAVERGPLTVRLGHTTARIGFNNVPEIDALLEGVRAVGAGYGFPQMVTLANALEVKDKSASFTSLGMMYDQDKLVVQAEYARRRTDSFFDNTKSWYAMAGYRMGNVLPYYLHASTKAYDRIANTVPGACPAGYPAACSPTLQALRAGVSSLWDTGSGEQTSDAIGVRWDLRRSLALKVQIDRLKPISGGGLLLPLKPGFNKPVTVGAVALDFVF